MVVQFFRTKKIAKITDFFDEKIGKKTDFFKSPQILRNNRHASSHAEGFGGDAEDGWGLVALVFVGVDEFEGSFDKFFAETKGNEFFGTFALFDILI